MVCDLVSAGTSAHLGGSEADWWGVEPSREGGVWEGDQRDKHSERNQQPLLGRGTWEQDVSGWLDHRAFWYKVRGNKMYWDG